MFMSKLTFSTHKRGLSEKKIEEEKYLLARVYLGADKTNRVSWKVARKRTECKRIAAYRTVLGCNLMNSCKCPFRIEVVDRLTEHGARVYDVSIGSKGHNNHVRPHSTGLADDIKSAILAIPNFRRMTPTKILECIRRQRNILVPTKVEVQVKTFLQYEREREEKFLRAHQTK